MNETSVNERSKQPQYIGKYLCESNRKKNVMLTVRRDLLAVAKEQKINLSKLLENSLIQLLVHETQGFSLSGGSLFGKRESPQGSGSIVRLSIVASRATDPGSNPGRSTTPTV